MIPNRSHPQPPMYPPVAPRLGELADVSAPVPVNGQVLAFNDTTGAWEPAAAGTPVAGEFHYGLITETADSPAQLWGTL